MFKKMKYDNVMILFLGVGVPGRARVEKYDAGNTKDKWSNYRWKQHVVDVLNMIEGKIIKKEVIEKDCMTNKPSLAFDICYVVLDELVQGFRPFTGWGYVSYEASTLFELMIRIMTSIRPSLTREKYETILIPLGRIHKECIDPGHPEYQAPANAGVE